MSPRIAPGSIASPSRTTLLGFGDEALEQVADLGLGMVLGLGDDGAEGRRGDRSLVDEPHEPERLAGRSGHAADRLGLGAGRRSRRRGSRVVRAGVPSCAIQSAISRNPRSSTRWEPSRGIRPAPVLAIR